MGGLITGSSLTSEGEAITTDQASEKNKLTYYSLTGIGATTYVVLVDLSDTTNWKHTETGRIDISFIDVSVDRAANSVGAVHIGVVTRVDSTNGDLAIFYGLHFNNAADTFISRISNYSPSQIKSGVVSGTLQQMVTNEKVTNSTAIQTDVALDSFLGSASVAPAVGDIVAQFAYTSGTAYGATIRMLYHSQASAT